MKILFILIRCCECYCWVTYLIIYLGLCMIYYAHMLIVNTIAEIVYYIQINV